MIEGQRYLCRGQSLERCLGVLLPACEGGFEHQLVVGGDAHRLHELRDIVDVEHVDDVATEAVAHDGSRVAFETRSMGGDLYGT